MNVSYDLPVKCLCFLFASVFVCLFVCLFVCFLFRQLSDLCGPGELRPVPSGLFLSTHNRKHCK